MFKYLHKDNKDILKTALYKSNTFSAASCIMAALTLEDELENRGNGKLTTHVECSPCENGKFIENEQSQPTAEDILREPLPNDISAIEQRLKSLDDAERWDNCQSVAGKWKQISTLFKVSYACVRDEKNHFLLLFFYH